VDTKEDNIIAQVRQMYLKYGIKSVTMDDVARELGISKKTLYLFFKDKNELVMKSMECQIALDKASVKTIVDRELNAIDELLEIAANVATTLKSIQPAVIFDIQKYYPQVWSLQMEYRQNFVVQTIIDNINKGIEQNLYRPNLNPEIIAKFFAVKLENMFDDKVFPTSKFDLANVYMEYIRYHLMGICNQNGADYIVKNIFNLKQS
jgi:AcrR family transcriptional regulator